MGTAANARFKKNFAALLAKAQGRELDVVRIIGRKMLASLIDMSPVGDPSGWASPAPAGYAGGRFKNNWNLDIGAPDYRDNNPIDASGEDAKARATEKLKHFAIGQTIFITNSMPYAYRLEHGWSGQAPRGMVRVTIVNYGNALRAAVQEAR